MVYKHYPDTDEEWDHYKQDRPKCPHCGYIDYDYWEWAYDLQEGYDEANWEEDECMSCEKKYEIAHMVTHSWSTRKKS